MRATVPSSAGLSYGGWPVFPLGEEEEEDFCSPLALVGSC